MRASPGRSAAGTRSLDIHASFYLHREEPIEERSIPSKPLSQVLRRHLLAALPPTLEHGPLLGQGFLKPLHHLSYQVLGLFDRSAGLVHETDLDAFPLPAESIALLAGEQRDEAAGRGRPRGRHGRASPIFGLVYPLPVL